MSGACDLPVQKVDAHFHEDDVNVAAEKALEAIENLPDRPCWFRFLQLRDHVKSIIGSDTPECLRAHTVLIEPTIRQTRLPV